MHNSILVKRNHAAHTRTLTLASALATTLKINPDKVSALTPKAKDKDVRLMMQREAIANLLGDIALARGIDVSPNGEAEPAAEAKQTPDGDQLPVGGDDQSPADGDNQILPDGEATEPSSGKTFPGDELPGPVIED